MISQYSFIFFVLAQKEFQKAKTFNVSFKSDIGKNG